MRTHLQAQTQEEQQAARSRFSSSSSLLGAKFGAAPPREPDWGPGDSAGGDGQTDLPGAAGPPRRRFSPRPAEGFARQRRVTAPRPRVPPTRRPKEAVDTSAPGRDRTRWLRTPPPKHIAPAAASPARSAPRCRRCPGGWGMLPGGGGSRPRSAASGCPNAAGPGGGNRQHPGLGCGGCAERRPGCRPPRRGCPVRAEPLRPPGAPHGARTSGPPPARPRLPAPPLATPAPDRPREICQQFAATLVITFLESAAIDVKIGSCLDFPLGIIVPVCSDLSLFLVLPNHTPPLHLLYFLPLGFPETDVMSQSLLLAPCPRRHSSLLAFVCPSIQPNFPVKASKNMQGLHCR